MGWNLKRLIVKWDDYWNEGLNEYWVEFGFLREGVEWILIYNYAFPCLSFKQYVFLQASGMMKMLTAFDFHLSLGKNMGTAFRRSAEKHNYKLIFTVYFHEKIKTQLIFIDCFVEKLGQKSIFWGYMDEKFWHYNN